MIGRWISAGSTPLLRKISSACWINVLTCSFIGKSVLLQEAAIIRDLHLLPSALSCSRDPVPAEEPVRSGVVAGVDAGSWKIPVRNESGWRVFPSRRARVLSFGDRTFVQEILWVASFQLVAGHVARRFRRHGSVRLRNAGWPGTDREAAVGL